MSAIAVLKVDHFLELSLRTSADSRQADVDPVSVSRTFIHQSQTAERRHLPPVQELLHQHHTHKVTEYMNLNSELL